MSQFCTYFDTFNIGTQYSIAKLINCSTNASLRNGLTLKYFFRIAVNQFGQFSQALGNYFFVQITQNLVTFVVDLIKWFKIASSSSQCHKVFGGNLDSTKIKKFSLISEPFSKTVFAFKIAFFVAVSVEGEI